jgi:hypothetical protein
MEQEMVSWKHSGLAYLTFGSLRLTPAHSGRIQTTDVSLIGTDLNVTDQVFASIYDATSGIGASGLMGFGFPLGSEYNTAISYSPCS